MPCLTLKTVGVVFMLLSIFDHHGILLLFDRSTRSLTAVSRSVSPDSRVTSYNSLLPPPHLLYRFLTPHTSYSGILGGDGASRGLSGVPSEGPRPRLPQHLRHYHRTRIWLAAQHLTTCLVEVGNYRLYFKVYMATTPCFSLQ